MKLAEIEIQNQAIYTLKILSQTTDKLFEEIAELSIKGKSESQFAPVILEIKNKHFQANELAVLMEVLTQNNIVAIGIRSQVQELVDFAKFSGLAVFDKPQAVVKEPEASQKNKKKKTPQPSAENIAKETPKETPKAVHDICQSNSKIVVGEVASSDQILAKECDLILMGEVQTDAEVLARGSIAARSIMKGKVFAGIDGDEKAMIFIHSFHAQLISIAGTYKEFKIIPRKLFEKSVVIDLHQGKLRFKVV
ncbi:Septum site-determining protein MinC [uncultured Candidatus Thioglobus sp.]|nr:Septum site-determining protein MinC [uncultured Candidatus Thioglobus sp.]